MPKEKTVTVHGVRIVLESFDSVPNSIEATLPDHTTYSLQEHHHVDDSYRIRKLGHRVNFPLIFGRVPARTMLSRFLQTIVEDWKQHQVQAAAEPERAWDLVPELVVYIGKATLKDPKTRNQVTMKSVHVGSKGDIILAFKVHIVQHDYDAINTGRPFNRSTVVDTFATVRPVQAEKTVYLGVNGVIVHKELDVTGPTAVAAKKIVSICLRTLMDQANAKTAKTIPAATAAVNPPRSLK
jgi:hypothetical protein